MFINRCVGEKMDYRCGNPPSICHFLGDVKQRSVGRIRRQLTEYASYDNGVLVTDLVKNTKSALYSTLDSSLRSDQEVQTYVDKIVSNTIRTLDSWVNKDVREICDTPDQEDLCNNFDDEIKLAILKWP
jgi:hypothetical protein